MHTIELNEVIRLHRLWLDGDMNGVRADLSGADLSNANLTNANLRYADLHNANLRNADLSDADLRYADLHNANLRYADLHNANLRNADLSDADLRYADLSDANLRYANLSDAIGDGSIIRTIQTGGYVVVICGPIVSIGCQSYNWTEWVEFNDTSIHNMDGQNAVDFWRIWKPILTAIIEVR
jgi:hypothetical protein